MIKYYMPFLCAIALSISTSFAQYNFEFVKDIKEEGGSSPKNTLLSLTGNFISMLIMIFMALNFMLLMELIPVPGWLRILIPEEMPTVIHGS